MDRVVFERDVEDDVGGDESVQGVERPLRDTLHYLTHRVHCFVIAMSHAEATADLMIRLKV